MTTPLHPQQHSLPHTQPLSTLTTTSQDESLTASESHPLTMTELLWHLRELRQRLLWCAVVFLVAFLASYQLAEHIFAALANPLVAILKQLNLPVTMVYTGLAEAFMTYINLSFYVAIALTWPVLAWNIWQFAAPGLYRQERKMLIAIILSSTAMFACGATFVYWLVIPTAWYFFATFATTSPSLLGCTLSLLPKIDQYFELILKLMITFGCCFQLPIILVCLVRLKVLNVSRLKSFRRYAVIIIAIISAIITPPDVFSQLALAVPLWLLYEGAIIGAHFIENNND